jgi:hypothetical protein
VAAPVAEAAATVAEVNKPAELAGANENAGFAAVAERLEPLLPSPAVVAAEEAGTPPKPPKPPLAPVVAAPENPPRLSPNDGPAALKPAALDELLAPKPPKLDVVLAPAALKSAALDELLAPKPPKLGAVPAELLAPKPPKLGAVPAELLAPKPPKLGAVPATEEKLVPAPAGGLNEKAIAVPGGG